MYVANWQLKPRLREFAKTRGMREGDLRNEHVDEVVLAISKEMLDRATSRASETTKDGDYKDFAADVSHFLNDELAQVSHRMTRYVVARKLGEYNLLNGYNCPRACLDGIDAIRAE